LKPKINVSDPICGFNHCVNARIVLLCLSVTDYEHIKHFKPYIQCRLRDNYNTICTQNSHSEFWNI